MERICLVPIGDCPSKHVVFCVNYYQFWVKKPWKIKSLSKWYHELSQTFAKFHGNWSNQIVKSFEKWQKFAMVWTIRVASSVYTQSLCEIPVVIKQSNYIRTKHANQSTFFLGSFLAIGSSSLCFDDCLDTVAFCLFSLLCDVTGVFSIYKYIRKI